MRDPAVCSAHLAGSGPSALSEGHSSDSFASAGCSLVRQRPPEILLAIDPVQDAIREMRQCARLRRRWKEMCSRGEKKPDGP